MAPKLVPCPACRKNVFATAPSCPNCVHPLATDENFQNQVTTKGSPIALALVSLVALVTVFAIIGVPTPRTDTAAANPQQRPAATTPITDAQVATAIQGSDDFGLHQAAFISGSRQFLARGGTIGDLQEMGGWVRSQSHKPRRVYFTYRRPGTHISHRWYFDIDSGGLFQ